MKAVENPPNPWRTTTLDWVGEPPEAKLSVYIDSSRSILSRNDSPDLSFRWSVNPYRGCFHGCAYCYARPTHQYLDFGAGTDFERKIVVKPDAAELLELEFKRRRWIGELIAFSGNTDCYQPLEASYGLTRKLLRLCLRYRNPVGIITKSALIERDIELLQRLNEETHLRVAISIPFSDSKTARLIEPHVPTPRRRLVTVRRLAEAGIPVGIMLAPIIPGLNDSQIPEILGAAHQAGARFAGRILLRLSGEVAQVFESRVRKLLPLRADRIMNQLSLCRDGQLSDARFGHRMRGSGERWRAIDQLFERTAERLGFVAEPQPPKVSPFRRPGEQRQLSLFQSPAPG